MRVRDEAQVNKGTNYAAVKKWERKNPERAMQCKRSYMLRKAERVQRLPSIKTLMKLNFSCEEIVSLVRAFASKSPAECVHLKDLSGKLPIL